MFVWSFASPAQIQNSYNILMVNNSTENLGSFWYLMLEMFPDRLEFMKMMYLLEAAVMYAFITMHLTKTYDVLEMQKKHTRSDKATKRKSLMMNGVLLITFVKLVMNPYPCLDDLSQIAFMVALNLKFIFKEVQALLLFFLGTLYAIMNSGFLWITWLKRFSGNANFFYFQTLVFQAFLVLFFIQIYIAVD